MRSNLYVLRFVGQRFGLTAGSSPPLPQPSLGVVGRWRAFRRLGSGGLLVLQPLGPDNHHGASIVGALVLRDLQHHHTLCIILAQSVQRDHCTDRQMQKLSSSTITSHLVLKSESLLDFLGLTCDSIHLHTGVAMGHGLRQRRRLVDWSRSWRRDVGNLQGQCSLVETWKEGSLRRICAHHVGYYSDYYCPG